jgi:hypothetical protein
MNAVKYLENALQEAKSNKLLLVMESSREEAIVNNLITLKTAQFSVDGTLLTLALYISCFSFDIDDLQVTFLKTSIIDFMSKQFSNRVKYEAALLLNKFSIENTISTSAVKSICKLLKKPFEVDVRIQEELLACLKNTFDRRDSSLDDVVVVKEFLKAMDDYLSNGKKLPSSVKLICGLVACLDKNYLHFLRFNKLIYSILMKLSFFQDTVIVLTSLKIIKKVFDILPHDLDMDMDTDMNMNDSLDEFYSFFNHAAMLDRLYCLLIQFENDADNQEIVLNVLSCLTSGNPFACTLVVQLGFLPIFLRLLQNTKYLFSKHGNLYKEICTIIKHILLEFADREIVMIDSGIGSLIIKVCLDKSTEFAPIFFPSLVAFCCPHYAEFGDFEELCSYHDPLCFQQRTKMILEGTEYHDDSFFEQTIFSMINFKAF